MEYLSYESEDFKSLSRLIEHYQTEKGSSDTNVIDQGKYKKTYNIPNNQIDIFLNTLDDICIKNKHSLCFSEKQLYRENGIFIDIDSYSHDINRVYTKEKLIGIILSYFDILLEYYEIKTSIEYHAFVMAKTEMIYDENEKRYKEGYHILIPDLWLIKPIRKILLINLKQENNAIDIATYANPSLYYGNCKLSDLSRNNRYKILYSYKVSLIKNRNRVSISTTEYELPKECNFIRELSLTVDGNILHKSSKVDNLVLLNDKKKELEKILDYKIDNTDDDETSSNIESTQIYDNVDTEILKSLLNILPSQYYDDRNLWRDILFAIYSSYKTALTNTSRNANCIDQYKDLGIWFSKKSKKYNHDDFIRIWIDIESRYGQHINNPITEKTIYYHAKRANPELFYKIMNTNNMFIIEEAIKKEYDALQHYTVAKILYNIIGNNIVYTSTGYRQFSWYSFVNSIQNKICIDEGNLYKWTCEENHPITLSLFMSEEVPKIIEGVIHKIDEAIGKEQNENITNVLKLKKKSLKKTVNNLCNNGFKKAVVEQCKEVFFDPSFANKLDSNDNVLGVKNGILMLPTEENPNIEHINGFNEYYVSKFTNTKYIDYKKPSKYKDEIMSILSDIIPEKDALEYILIFFSTSLSFKSKEPVILFFKGGGSNGKSTLLELMLNTMGDYAKKLALGILTDKREQASNSNSAFMDLKSNRFGYFSEPDKSEVINTGRLKEILGNEKLTGRQLYGKQENFENKCNLVAASNYDFTINCGDHGIWRRIKYYSCKVKFVENPTPGNKYEKLINKKYISDIVKDPKYLEAFLSILVENYVKYIEKYGGELKRVHSETIMSETIDYRNRQDILNKFITENGRYLHDKIFYVEEFISKYRDWLCIVRHQNISSFNKSSLNTIVTIDELTDQLKNSSLSTFLCSEETTGKYYLKNINIVYQSPINNNQTTLLSYEDDIKLNGIHIKDYLLKKK